MRRNIEYTAAKAIRKVIISLSVGRQRGLRSTQSGAVYEGTAVREYLKRVQYIYREYGETKPMDNYIFRMDDAEFNPRVVDRVLEAGS